MRKIFRFGISSSSDTFVLITILETMFGLVYVVLAGTELFTAGLYLNSSSTELMIPPMIKWLVSLIKLMSIFILWAHLLKSVQKRLLHTWIAIGVIYDILPPLWIIVLDIRNEPVAEYPPLYRTVLFLCFRVYIYYFMGKFTKELKDTTATEKETSKEGRVHFASACSLASRVSTEFGVLLSLDLDGLKRLVKILFITEIIWNTYVILMHEVRITTIPAQRILTMNETVRLEMIWIRLGFILISILGLVLLCWKKLKCIMIGLSICYFALTLSNLAFLQVRWKWNLVALLLKLFFVGANVVAKCCVGALIFRLGLLSKRDVGQDQYQAEVVGPIVGQDSRHVELVFVINNSND